MSSEETPTSGSLRADANPFASATPIRKPLYDPGPVDTPSAVNDSTPKPADANIARTLSRYRAARDYLVGALGELPGIEIAAPTGAMYAFFRVHGLRDSLGFCKRLVHDAKLGLAPGSAFGPEGEGFVRWCFASDVDRLRDGVARLSRFLASRDSK